MVRKKLVRFAEKYIAKGFIISKIASSVRKSSTAALRVPEKETRRKDAMESSF